MTAPSPNLPSRSLCLRTRKAVKPEPEPAIPVLASCQALVDGTVKVPVPPPETRPEARPEALLKEGQDGKPAGSDGYSAPSTRP